jgi:hypothetical protein
MIIIEEANIQNLIFHKIKLDEKDATTSNASIDIEYEDDENTLKKIFLKPFLMRFLHMNFSMKLILNSILCTNSANRSLKKIIM